MPRLPSRKLTRPMRAEQVLRPLAEAGQELDRQQVEEALDEPAHAVLRVAEACAAGG